MPVHEVVTHFMYKILYKICSYFLDEKYTSQGKTLPPVIASLAVELQL